ncbi:TPA: thioredoxin domain-containing protein [Klebsiella aerogenes]|jgi:protein-disulfide isomerase|uniref:DsbA family protein n=1 Tax=Klebsiella aerogenes TaxID=548 RepID=UPI00063C118D|nr:DsbA family protein [Klebsiella aerogenes]EKU0352593.1 thioredoxin domain-containing protein [Klebsiella aerogenes]ELA3176450.1 thioredoxin domain-containing protein [Klebsiella aerogenes]ELN9404693.1 thioredoxin domain-containing protein [Klebsiella aerogenes]ELX9631070.1 thioredoxin domain-containing protein [Klebsiella aerogenes]EMB4080663.1 thioredoxin domain-containing protein [Klebsiella aerogenes]
MRAITALLLLCVSAFSFAAPAEEPQSNGNDQLAQLLFNDPNSPRTGAKEPKLTIVSFTDYNCPYCKQFDPMLEKIVHDNPDIQLIVKLLPFKGQSSVNAAKAALSTWRQQPDKFWTLHQRLMAKKGYHDDASIAAAQKKTATDSVNIDDKTMDSLKMNLILSQVLNIQGTPATIIGDQMVAGAIPAEDLEGLVKEQLAKARGQ